jgi:hypothetical protein
VQASFQNSSLEHLDWGIRPDQADMAPNAAAAWIRSGHAAASRGGGSAAAEPAGLAWCLGPAAALRSMIGPDERLGQVYFSGVLEEIDDLDQFGLGLIDASRVVERDPPLAGGLVERPCTALARLLPMPKTPPPSAGQHSGRARANHRSAGASGRS